MTAQVTDANFEDEVQNSPVPVLVDFYADWCGPCKALGPIITELSKEMADKIRIYKMDIDANPETPSKFGVRSIPTMMLFKNGKQIGTKVGALPKPSIVEWIESSI